MRTRKRIELQFPDSIFKLEWNMKIKRRIQYKIVDKVIMVVIWINSTQNISKANR